MFTIHTITGTVWTVCEGRITRDAIEPGFVPFPIVHEPFTWTQEPSVDGFAHFVLKATGEPVRTGQIVAVVHGNDDQAWAARDLLSPEVVRGLASLAVLNRRAVRS